jgi:choline dehydrogenase-like flavoprotein
VNPAEKFDIVIIGSGMGGGTLAYALRESGARILLVERGGYLPQEPENWSPKAVFKDNRYKSPERWTDAHRRPFSPGVHYFVGGNTKVYGAALPRFRREDFEALEHEGGTSPAWPIRYEDLEPYYAAAERLYFVHGDAGADPCEPPRSSPYPFPPVPHEPYIVELHHLLRHQGLRPYTLPVGIDLRAGGRCIRCKTCDGFPCQVLAKADAEVCAVRPALEHEDVLLWTNAYATRLLTDSSGKHVTAVEIEQNGALVRVQADLFVISCGAVNSAALLLRSANAAHPRGLANSSGLVGRNYMVHNNTALMAVDPRRRNPTQFQKTLAVNDFYLGGGEWPYPLGNLQMLGKLQAGMLTAKKPFVPTPILQSMADHSVEWWVMSEDLPHPENRATLTPAGGIQVHWQPTNRLAHEKLIETTKRVMREAGYPLILVQRMGIETNSHQCGTLRFGNDPETAVLDATCKAYDLDNLYAIDSSFFPSSAAINPGLTIAAQALRVAEHLVDHRTN